jgi:hypothetical protein
MVEIVAVAFALWVLAILYTLSLLRAGRDDDRPPGR